MRQPRLSVALSSASRWFLSAAVMAPAGGLASPAVATEVAPHCPVVWDECVPSDAVDEPEGTDTLPPVSPMVWFECLQRDTLRDLEDAGATSWELLAVRAITRDGESKGPVDLVETDCGAHGWAHFSPGRLDLNITYATACPYDDPNWRDATLAVLYSDRAGALTLAAWRRIVGPAVREARQHGWRRRELALAAAIGNSAPTLLVRLGDACGWSPTCVAHRYARGSEHRERRIAWLGSVSGRRRWL